MTTFAPLLQTDSLKCLDGAILNHCGWQDKNFKKFHFFLIEGVGEIIQNCMTISQQPGRQNNICPYADRGDSSDAHIMWSVMFLNLTAQFARCNKLL
jgi:hypothetical protein